ncbi:unnamed protein product, partial [Closterium sp. NIES-65]
GCSPSPSCPLLLLLLRPTSLVSSRSALRLPLAGDAVPARARGQGRWRGWRGRWRWWWRQWRGGGGGGSGGGGGGVEGSSGGGGGGGGGGGSGGGGGGGGGLPVKEGNVELMRVIRRMRETVHARHARGPPILHALPSFPLTVVPLHVAVIPSTPPSPFVSNTETALAEKDRWAPH